MEAARTERRSLKYIRLAAYLAGQPQDIDRIVLTLTADGGRRSFDPARDRLPDASRWGAKGVRGAAL